MKNLNIAMIGSGNVAWHLALALENAGHVVTAVYSKHRAHAKILVDELYHAKISRNLDFSKLDIDLVLIAVSDDAIETVAKQLIVSSRTIVIHTAGSTSIDLLDREGSSWQNFGVFYPLQTFSKTADLDLQHTPFLIEANNKKTYRIMRSMAASLSDTVEEADSEKRKQLHLAAVFACNYANHMFTIAQNYCEEQGLNFELLFPLIEETVNKMFELGPREAQTGPARRGDQYLMKTHEKMLSDQPALRKLYKLLGESVVNAHPL